MIYIWKLSDFTGTSETNNITIFHKSREAQTKTLLLINLYTSEAMNNAGCSVKEEVWLLKSISYCLAINLKFSKLPFRL